MENKKLSIDPNSTLPPNMAMRSSCNHLYRIGLSHYKFGDRIRSNLFNPWLIFICSCIMWIRFVFTLIIRPDSKEISIMIGDFTYFIGIREQYNSEVILIYLMSMISQIIHYWYFKQNKYPTYMKPFLLLSGIKSPKSIGLTDKLEIFKFVIHAKHLMLISKFILSFAPIACITFSLYPLAINGNFQQLILFSIPWTLLLTYSAICIFQNILWQLIYFKIICYYLKIKLRIINKKIISFRIRKFNIILAIKSLQSIHSEIKEYNNNYWSEFLFWLCITFTPINAFGAYQLFFVNYNILISLVYIYAILLTSFMLYYPLNSASSVVVDANKSYKHLMNTYIKNSIIIKFSDKLKVFTNSLIITRN
jgi:hypothetical protein